LPLPTKRGVFGSLAYRAEGDAAVIGVNTETELGLPSLDLRKYFGSRLKAIVSKQLRWQKA